MDREVVVGEGSWERDESAGTEVVDIGRDERVGWMGVTGSEWDMYHRRTAGRDEGSDRSAAMALQARPSRRKPSSWPQTVPKPRLLPPSL